MKLNRRSLSSQILGSMTLVVAVTLFCILIRDYTGYKIIAFILMAAVSVIAMLFQILPVMLAALLTSLIWNFLFIPPTYSFQIDKAEDNVLFFMFFIIACINAVLNTKIRRAEKEASEKEEKEHTIKLYNTLLNSLSHELKTPLATIVGAIDTLKENDRRLSETHRTELFAALDTAAMRLNRQVENLLNMSRLESGFLKLKLDWCDTNELGFSLKQKYFSEQPAEKIKFTGDEKLPLFKLDQGLIEVALYNMIYNAIQYTPEGSVISLEFACKDDQCIISVSDNGPGFPESQIHAVFDKFYRLPESKTGGTGLGLSIVKGYTEAHGGQVKLENIPGGGARFTLIIPAETHYINHLKNE